MGRAIGEIAVVAGDIVAWGCSILVIFAVSSYVIFEGLKRWRVGLRLASLDESLLYDDGVKVEEIMDVPAGSSLIGGVVAEFLENGRP